MLLPLLDATVDWNRLCPLQLRFALAIAAFFTGWSCAPAGSAGANVSREPRQGPWWSQLQLETWTTFEALPPEKPVMISPAPLRCSSTSEPPFSLAAELFPMPEPRPFLQCGAASWSVGTRSGAGLKLGRVSGLGQETRHHGRQVQPALSARLSLWASTWMHAPHEQESRLRVSLLSVSLVLQAASGTTLPSTRLQGRDTRCVPLPARCLGRISAHVIFILLSLFPGVQVPTWLLVYPSYLIPYGSIGVSACL